MFVLEWLHYIIAWCVSHMFQVMANGETFGRSLILSPHPSTPDTPAKPSRATPTRSQSTPKTSLYRRLSARLSGRHSSLCKPSADAEVDHLQEDREMRMHLARKSLRDKHRASKEHSDDFCNSDLGMSLVDELSPYNDMNKVTQNVEFRKYNISNKENKDTSRLLHSSSRNDRKDKREVFRNRSMNVFNLVDCLTEAGSLHSSLTKSLCDLDSKDEPAYLLPQAARNKELHQSTTTISSGKKRSRNSTDSNFQVSVVDVNLSPDKSEENNWKSIKRLKIKDSFKFKNRPAIFKRTKKDSVLKPTGDIVVEPVSPDSVKPTDPAGELVASASSPIQEDDNASICSNNTSKQLKFFDSSFASKTVKSASKLRRSVKSFTASFRSERKKKYEKRAERNTVEVDPSHLPCNIQNVSTPKREIDDMNFDISPLQVDTVDSTEPITPMRDRDIDELDDSNVFKTPQSVWLRSHRHSICGGLDIRSSSCSLPLPLVGPPPSPRRRLPAPFPSALAPPVPSGRDQTSPASSPPTRDARAITQCHGISLPVLTPFYSVLTKNSIAFL